MDCQEIRRGQNPYLNKKKRLVQPTISMEAPVKRDKATILINQSTQMKLFKYLCLLAFAVACTQCGPSDDMPNPNNLEFSCDDNPDVCELTAAQNQFGWNLFEKIYTETPDKNLFISPLSMAVALSMTANGARGNTFSEMEATLEWAGNGIDPLNQRSEVLLEALPQLDQEVDLTIANSIWYRQEFPVEEAFLELNNTHYQSEINPLDFADPTAKETINNWVDDATNGLIEEIVEAINPDDIMFLINAIYFKGNWKYEFEEDKTEDGDFTLADGTTQSTPFMKVEGANLDYFENLEVQAIRLPYADGAFGMTIILPKEQVAMSEVISDLQANGLWEQIKEGSVEVESIVRMPKFTMEYEDRMNRFLIDLGMPLAFTNGGADFSGIGPGGLFISRVRHKAFVEVNEVGTEAAAVTSVAVTNESASLSGFVNCDRPFLFVISDQSAESIQFVGHYSKPE